MDNIVFNLPKDVELSQHIREKAEAYFEVMRGGRHYYIPLTLQTKRLFGLKRRGKKFIFKSWTQRRQIFKFLEDIIDSLYLLVRDCIVSEIHQDLSQQIQNAIQERLDEPLWNKIQKEYVKVLPPPKEDKDE